MGSEQHYSLRWNDYTVKIVTAFQSLRDEEDFVDVTVACDGHSYSAHKMVLSACSPYFRTLLRANPCQHPIVILKDVGHVELERLLEFMYNGEVSIAQDQLAAFLKTAENLKIRGLAGSSDEMDQAGVHRPDVSYSFTSGSGLGGVTSDRSSPSAGYAPSQSSKDDEMAGDGYHTRPDSPPAKRRKRSSAPAAAAAAGHTDSTSASHTAEGVAGDSSVDVDSGGALGGGGLSGDDDARLDRREMKSEPAMPGPSGAAGGQEGGSSHEPGDEGVGMKQETDGEVLDMWLGDVNTTSLGDVDYIKPPSPPPPPPPDQPQPQPPPQQIEDEQVWAPFVTHSTAPLTHLETLTHSTFMSKSEQGGDGTAQGGIASEDLAIEAVLPPPTPWFPCPQCGKSFRTRITLTRHEKIHKGNAFPCPMCPKVFYQVSNVKYHVHAVHGRQYESPIRGSPHEAV